MSTFLYFDYPMDQKIKVFLESPKSLELASESSIKKAKEQLKQKAKMNVKVKKDNRKSSKLPKFVPVRSIYEIQDLSKLTERQRILALKFQTMKDQASNLFLAVNNINMDSSKNSDCLKCKNEFESLKSFCFWLINQHNCSKKIQIMKVYDYLKNQNDCVCQQESTLYSKVSKFLGLKCCCKNEN